MHNWAKGWGDFSLDALDEVERRKQNVISMLPSSGVHLDLGCGNGDLPLSLLESGVNSYGLEPDLSAAAHAVVMGLQVFPDVSSVPEDLRFDVISLIHVVEHFYDVVLELITIRELLKPNAFLLLETPNADDALLSRYGSDAFERFTYWSHHPSLCTNRFLEEALVEAGYSIHLSTQIQRYGLANHLAWLSKGIPVGHTNNSDWSNPQLDERYSEALVEAGVADTVWIVAQKI